MSSYTENKVIDDPNHVWNMLGSFIPEKSAVLDIGCSSANFGEALIAKKKCIVDGVEPDADDAAIASKKLGKVWSFNIEDPANIARIGKQYDVIVFADVLEHLMAPAKTLQTIKPLLKPKGRVVFSVPNMAHISIRLSLLKGQFQYTETGLLDKTHLHFYDLETVRQMFDDAHMNLIKVDGVIYGYPVELLTSRLKEMGLTASKLAVELLRKPEASIFQYVGYADYKLAKSDDRLSKKLLDKRAPALSRDIQVLVDNLEAERQKIKRLDKDLGELHKQIHDLRTSREYLIGAKLTHAKQITKTKLARLKPSKRA